MGIGNFLLKKSFVDMDYVYGTLSNANGEYPLDYPAFRDDPMELWVVATDALTGKATYFTKDDFKQDDYAVLKASSSIPVVCRPYPVHETPCFDGGLGDPVPIKKAFELGCDKVVLILTKPESEIRNSKKEEKLATLIQKKYPAMAESLRHRAELYNEGVALAQKYTKEGRVLIISPDDICGMDTFKRDKEALKRLYEKGINDAHKIPQFIQNF